MPNDMAPQVPQTAPTGGAMPVLHNEGEFSMLLDTGKFHQLQRIGKMYASSKMVPAHFQGDEASCMVAVQMAMRLQVDPFMFLQKTYVVGGKPGMEAQMAIALVNTRGPFEGPIDWNFKRDANGKVVEATAFATHKKTGRVCSATVDWDMVTGEGWDKNKKWHSLREQMFAYRSGVFLARRYCPEVLMGMSLEDELREIELNPAPALEPAGTTGPKTLKEKLGIVDAQPVDQTAKAIQAGLEGAARRMPPPDASTEELVDAGHIVIHDDPPTGGAAPQGAPATSEAATGAGGGQNAPTGAQGGGAMPFENVLAHAKRAKTAAQVEIVRDVLRGDSYSAEQKSEVETILNSKKLQPELG